MRTPTIMNTEGGCPCDNKKIILYFKRKVYNQILENIH